MATLVKDTNELINFLQSKGYSKEQAKGFVDAVKDFNVDQLATKDHVQSVSDKLRADLYRYIFGIAVGQAAFVVALIQLLK